MTMKQLDSVTTTFQKATSLSTSTEPIDSGVGTALTTAQQKRSVEKLLEINNPTEVDNKLVTSLESITGYKVIELTNTRFGSHGAEFYTRGFNITVNTIDDAYKAIRAVECSLATMSPDAIKDQLALLATLVVKPSGETPEDHELRINSLAYQLMEYPADIVVFAIKKVSETCRFWPSYAEFHQHIEWRVKKRKMLLNTLTKKLVDLTA